MHAVPSVGDWLGPFERLYQLTDHNLFDWAVATIAHEDWGALLDAVLATLEVGNVRWLCYDSDEYFGPGWEGPVALDAGDEVGPHLRVNLPHRRHDRLLELRAGLAQHQRPETGVVVFADRVGYDERGFPRARGPPKHEHLGGRVAGCVLGIGDRVPVPSMDFRRKCEKSQME